MDTFSPTKRSAIMSRIGGRSTRPEMVVRKIVSSLGFRYRLHLRDLPGCPDLAFIGKKKAVFVHGCFWHQHSGCPRSAKPTTNIEFWKQKLQTNTERDRRALSALDEMGWSWLTIWQCEMKDLDHVTARLKEFIQS